MTTLETSLFLAQFWGSLIFIMSVMFLIRRKVLTEEFLHSVRDRSFTIFSGILAVVLGLVTVLLHNVWILDWRLLVTLFGWASLIKGITLIGYPESIKSITKILKRNPVLMQAMLVIALLVGTWLLWVSTV